MPTPNTDAAISDLVGGDSISEMLAGLREHVDVSSGAADTADTEWPTTPTDVEFDSEAVSSEVSADASAPAADKAETEDGAPQAGADKAPEEPAETPEAPADNADSPDNTDNTDTPDTPETAQKEPVAADADVPVEDIPEPVVVDTAKVEAEYQQSADQIKETLERKYAGFGRELQSKRTAADSEFHSVLDPIKAQAEAIYANAVTYDPVSEKTVERPLLPSEQRRLDELREIAQSARENYTSKVRDIEAQSRAILNDYTRDEATAKLNAWTNYIVGCDPRLMAVKDVVRDMALSGEIRSNADGKIDSEELYLRAQYRAKLLGKSPAPAARVVTDTDLKKAQEIQAAQKQQAAIRERGLGTIAAGSGGGSGAGKAAAKTPDYMQGASPEVVAGLRTLDAYMNGEL